MIQLATKEQMQKEFNFFRDVWDFFKRHYDVRRDDEYWAAVVDESAAINEKYNCELCRDILVAVTKELDRRGKATQNEKL